MSKKKFIFIAIAVLLIAAVASWKPISVKIKELRSDQFYEEALVHSQNQNFNTAISKATLAIQLDPNNLKATRFLATSLSMLGRLEAFAYWDRILANDTLTNDEYTHYISLALKLGHLDRIADHLSRLIDTPKKPELNHLILAIQFFQIEGSSANALTVTKKAYEHYPDNANVQFILAQLLLGKQSPKDIEKSYQLLQQLTQHDNAPVRYQAYKYLIEYFNPTESVKSRMLNEIKQEDTTAENIFVKHSLLIEIDPHNKYNYVQQVMQFRQETPTLSLTDTSRWLNSHRAYHKTLEILKEKQALESENLLIVYLDALTGLNQWDKLYDIIFQDDLPIDPFILNLFRARSAMKSNEPKLADVQQRTALQLAKKTPAKLSFMAEYFHKLSMWDYAVEAYELLMQERNYATNAARQIIGIAEVTKNTPLIYRTLRTLTQSSPASPTIKSDLLYIQFLLNEYDPSHLSKAKDLFISNPKSLPIRITYALSLVKQENYQSAHNLLQGLSYQQKNILPGWLAIHCASLASVGKTDQAQQVLESIDKERLKPEELKLIEDFLPSTQENASDPIPAKIR